MCTNLQSASDFSLDVDLGGGGLTELGFRSVGGDGTGPEYLPAARLLDAM
jgi:hypothetical protein